jgi:hypothetical protein
MKKLTLTNSRIDRQNILNNDFAIQEIEKSLWIQWFNFENKFWFTKRQIAEFFEVNERTIDRYIRYNIHNEYLILRHF